MLKYGPEPKILFSSTAIRYGLLKEIYKQTNIDALREDAFVTYMVYNNIDINYIKEYKKNTRL